MTREEYVKSIRETAEEYFRSGTFFCSEAVLQTINDELVKQFTDEIVKMASSFPIGMGKAQCLCGAVSGGEMALGIVYGRVKGQPMDPKMFPVAKGLHDFIKEKYGAKISVIVYESSSDVQCGHLVAAISISDLQ